MYGLSAGKWFLFFPRVHKCNLGHKKCCHTTFLCNWTDKLTLTEKRCFTFKCKLPNLKPKNKWRNRALIYFYKVWFTALSILYETYLTGFCSQVGLRSVCWTGAHSSVWPSLPWSWCVLSGGHMRSGGFLQVM